MLLTIAPLKTDEPNCICFHCGQLQTFSIALSLSEVSVIFSLRHSTCIIASGTQSNTINRLLEISKLTNSLNNDSVSNKPLYILHRPSLLPTFPLHEMPLCVGLRTHRIRIKASFLSLSALILDRSRSRIDCKPTAHRLRQTATIQRNE